MTSRPNIRTLPVRIRRVRTSHSFCGVGGQLFETKRVAVPDRLSAARSQGGGFFRASRCIYHQENLAENETLRLAIGQIRGQR